MLARRWWRRRRTGVSADGRPARPGRLTAVHRGARATRRPRQKASEKTATEGQTDGDAAGGGARGAGGGAGAGAEGRGGAAGRARHAARHQAAAARRAPRAPPALQEEGKETKDDPSAGGENGCDGGENRRSVCPYQQYCRGDRIS